MLLYRQLGLSATLMMVILWPLTLMAEVPDGILCVDCHTMHYSQGDTQLAGWGSSGPYGGLLNNDCLGCHTGENGTGSFPGGILVTPYVQDTSAVYNSTGTENDTTTLAGGNFRWVLTDDRTGHNIHAANTDGLLATPPGYNGTDFLDPDSDAAGGGVWSGQITCAGTNGCHGKHDTTDQMAALDKAHHSDDSTIDGSTVARSYRFLYGIVGLEDSDREYRPTAAAHNQYKGLDRSADITAGATATISYLCAECHGKFHSGAGDEGIDSGTFGSAWYRHPVDYDMANTADTSEYADYPDGSGSITARPYSVEVPVASDNVGSVLSTVNLDLDTANDTAIITCISCHRAHGTPYDSLLRWDYKAWPGGGYAGCQVCHSTKN